MRTPMLLLAALTCSAPAFADDGYWHHSAATIWRTTDGHCWRTTSWSADKAIPGCEAAAPAAGPVLDSDRDGVTDDRDRCPATPDGAAVDAVGCPRKLEGEVTIALDVHFATGSANIVGDATQEISKVADFMRKYSSVNVSIEGYTDNVGSVQSNKKLSQARADAVRNALVKSGVAGSRLTATGYGPDNPVADNTTAEGRAKNRRVVAHARAEVETLEQKR